MDQFYEANRQLTLAGHIVYTVAMSSHGDWKPSDTEKAMLDAVHLRKIHESDCVLVVGKQEDGSTYIGESTRKEIMYARVWGKDVYFYNPEENVVGPAKDFEGDINGAAETNAVREARKAQAEARRKEFLSAFGHTGEDDCPACDEAVGDEAPTETPVN